MDTTDTIGVGSISSTNDFRIGYPGYPDGTTYFNGAIDDLNIYNRSLTLSEVQQLYHIESTPPTISSFTLPLTSTSLTVGISTFVASDNVAITDYCIAEVNSSSACAWTKVKPVNYTFTSEGATSIYAFTKDASGNVSSYATAATTITPLDTTVPTITVFTIPTTSTSLMIAISSFSAADNVGITGYCLTETNSSNSCTWSTIKPTNYIFSAVGSKTLYSFAKDTAGNISAPLSASVYITLTDVASPWISSFIIPATSSSLTVAVTTFTVTDNVGVTGYCLSEAASSAGCIWSATKPTNYLFSSAGSKTLNAYAIDLAGNISGNGITAAVTITLSDTIAPTITAFTIPSFSNSLTVAIASLIATDNVAVTGYCLIESNSSTGCNWISSAPANYIFTTAGNKTLYAFAKDTAGNISISASAAVVITLSDSTIPTISAFTIPTTATNLTVPVTTLTATDNVGVTDYCLSETNSSTNCTWSTTKPANFVFTTPGSKILYAFVKDAAGNISTGTSTTVSIAATGDINADGKVDVSDALLGLNSIVGKTTLSATEKLQADVAPFVSGKPIPDSKVTIADVVLILEKVVAVTSW